MKEVTIKELAVANGLNPVDANGLIKSLEKLGVAKKVGERKSANEKGLGRASTVYQIDAEAVKALKIKA